MGLREGIEDIIRPLRNQVANMVARAVVKLVDDSTEVQLVQVDALADETLDECERFQDYGVTSVPPAGAEAVLVFPDGDRAHALVVAVGDREYRLTGLESGEVALYNDQGAYVKLATNGDVVCVPGGSGKIKLGSESSADPVALLSDVQTLRDEVNTFISGKYDIHFHTGVTTGGGSSGTPSALGSSLSNPTGSSKADSE